MHRALILVGLTVSLFASSVALAQPAQQPGCVSGEESCQFLNMDEYLVEGGLQGPAEKLTFTTNGASFDRHAQLKRSFRPELESSLADSALDP